MSNWLREVDTVEIAGYSVQYAGLESERSPLLGREANEKCVRIFWILFLTILFCTGFGIGFYLIVEEDHIYPTTKSYIQISRPGWRAQPPLGQISLYPDLVSHISIMQTGTQGCDPTSDCARIIRDIQHRHVYEKNLTDIAYNFLVAGDGATYEGRGWKLQPGVGDDRERMLVVAFLGNFEDSSPPNIQIDEFRVFLREAMKRGVLDPCFTISLHKSHPQDGGGQLVHVFNRLVMENTQRKALIKCS